MNQFDMQPPPPKKKKKGPWPCYASPIRCLAHFRTLSMSYRV
jgi:hypothetical protein